MVLFAALALALVNPPSIAIRLLDSTSWNTHTSPLRDTLPEVPPKGIGLGYNRVPPYSRAWPRSGPLTYLCVLVVLAIRALSSVYAILFAWRCRTSQNDSCGDHETCFLACNAKMWNVISRLGCRPIGKGPFSRKFSVSWLVRCVWFRARVSPPRCFCDRSPPSDIFQAAAYA